MSGLASNQPGGIGGRPRELDVRVRSQVRAGDRDRGPGDALDRGSPGGSPCSGSPAAGRRRAGERGDARDVRGAQRDAWSSRRRRVSGRRRVQEKPTDNEHRGHCKPETPCLQVLRHGMLFGSVVGDLPLRRFANCGARKSSTRWNSEKDAADPRGNRIELRRPSPHPLVRAGSARSASDRRRSPEGCGPPGESDGGHSFPM